MKALFCGQYKSFMLINLAVLLCVSGICPAEDTEDDLWSEDISPKISDEYASYILSDVEKQNPELAQKLYRLRNTDKQEFLRQLHEYKLLKGVPENVDDTDKYLNEEYFKWAKQFFVEEADNLEAVKKKHPENFERYLTVSRRQYGRIMEVHKRSPELAQAMKDDVLITKERGILLAKIGRSEGQQREKLIAELKQVVDKRFDIIVRKKQLQYELLEKRIDKLCDKIKQQKDETQKLIENKEQKTKERLEELLSEVEKVNWDK